MVFVNDNSIAFVSTESCIDPYVTMAMDGLVIDIASKKVCQNSFIAITSVFASECEPWQTVKQLD